MTNYKNDLPLYAEQITINQEVEQIQQILSQFKQVVPSNFVELKQLNWMCSTQGWKEPLCERYNCLIKGEWKQVDISHTLLEKLELEKAKNIPHPFYISSVILDKGLDNYFAYHVENKEEVFLEKPFTIDNLEEDINKLLDKIEKLELEKNLNKQTIEDLERDKNDWKNEWLTEWRKNRTLTTEINNLQQSLSNSQNYLKSNLINSLFKNKRIRELNNCLSFLRNLLVDQNQEITNLDNRNNNLQTQLNQLQNERDNSQNQVNDLTQQLTDTNNLINNLQNLLGIDNLNNLPVLPQGETLYSLLTRPTLTQLNDLRREKDQELAVANNIINQKDTQIINLTQQLNNLQTNYNTVNNQLITTSNELQKEKDWWDKWINDDSFFLTVGSDHNLYLITHN